MCDIFDSEAVIFLNYLFTIIVFINILFNILIFNILIKMLYFQF